MDITINGQSVTGNLGYGNVSLENRSRLSSVFCGIVETFRIMGYDVEIVDNNDLWFPSAICNKRGCMQISIICILQ